MLLVNNPRFRSLARATGLHTTVGKLFRLNRTDTQQELALMAAISDNVHDGDCVWDVGANVGYYTCELAEKVGPTGSVAAFEPFGATYNQLVDQTKRFANVHCYNVALGEKVSRLSVSGDATNASNRIWEASKGEAEQVTMTTGAELVASGVRAPDVLKVDVEGYEEEVLWGMRDVLRGNGCRALFMEIHYALLESRGNRQAPTRIISTLQDLKFKTSWLNHSHLMARR